MADNAPPAASKLNLSVAEAEALLKPHLPGYRVVRFLGVGSFGQVFLLEDEIKQVALKILPLERRGEGGPTRTGERDWRRLFTHFDLLHHPSLVRIRDFFRCPVADPTSPIALYGLVVLDYWPENLKGCVRRLIKEKRHTPARQRTLLLDLALLLQRLKEEAGLLVTDLKPENILARCGEHGPIQLAVGDLGGVHRIGGATLARVETTRNYWAPELREDRSNEVDETALVYSYGMIGFLALEGRRPFLGENPDLEQPDWSQPGPPELESCRRVIGQCLRPREERLPDFASVAARLRAEQAAWELGQRVAAPPAPAAGPWREAITGMELLPIPGGRFLMGQSEEEREQLTRLYGPDKHRIWFSRELPRHPVTLGPFWLARTPVTVGQFRLFAEETLHLTDAEREGWSMGLVGERWGEREGWRWRQPGFAQEDDHPVVAVSWFDAQAYAAWLSRRTGLPFRLPSEAEWEYACRGGSDTPFHTGATIGPHQAHYDGRGVYGPGQTGGYHPGTVAVGRYGANGFGLHDMHGNIWEWCQDGFDERYYEVAPERDPLCRHGGGYRVRRGGSWSYHPAYLRAAYRGRNYPDSRYTDIGFRLALAREGG